MSKHSAMAKRRVFKSNTLGTNELGDTYRRKLRAFTNRETDLHK